MNRRLLAVAAVVVSTLVSVAGCSRTVGGAAQRVIDDGGTSARGYGYTDDRCGLVPDSEVQEIVGADKVRRPYSGAVCQYLLLRQSTVIDVTYSWFEAGSLDRERSLAQANTAHITDVVVDRHQGFVAHRPVIADACSAAAATSPGVASWWVQIRGPASIDPCQTAQTLLSKTLSSDM